MRKQLLTIALFACSLLYVNAQVIISEIMYNPAPGTAADEQLYEFLELTNIGSSEIDLSGYSFSAGIIYTFPSASKIQPGEYIVLVRDVSTFNQRYPGITPFGTYLGGIKNSGETLTLVDGSLNTIYSVEYFDISPWPVLADGGGFSLIPVDINSSDSPNNASFWTTSSVTNGTPGTEDTPSTENYEVYINELLSSPDINGEDSVEIYNAGTEPVDISGWYLTDDRKDPKGGYPIPDNTIIPAGGFYVIEETKFNFLDLGFSFSRNGDEIYLFAANDSDQLTGYSHGFTFQAQLENTSFGRVVTTHGVEYFVRQKEMTLGAKNAEAWVGPVVIEKIMYSPDNITDEFLVITNTSDQKVELATEELVDSNVYRISGVNFKFPEPSNTFLEAGESLILTQLDAAAFRTKYTIPASTQIFNYPSALNNSGENIVIETPIYRDTIGIDFDNHYLVIDQVNYSANAPWPAETDATGSYLQRIDLTGFGSEPQNWKASNAPITGTEDPLVTSTPFVYPTITTNFITIDNEKIQQLDIISSTGKLVKSYDLIPNRINIEYLPKGIYLLRGQTTSNEVMTSKIKKE